jgi:starvation-inducible DNA-binding protein
MSNLGDKMKVVLADTFCMYLKAHNYHWNITGPDFYQYHTFFESIYTQLWEAVDLVAEHIRAINEFAPGGLDRFKQLSSIEDEIRVVDSQESVRVLISDNEKVIVSLKAAYDEAEKANEIGLSNFIQDRIDIHKKLGWMLKATNQ